MSHENADNARAMLERWTAGDRSAETIARYCAPTIELRSPFSSVIGEPYRGYTGVERWSRDIDDQFAEWSILVDEVRQEGDRVLILSTVEVRGRVSDLAMSFAAAATFEFGTDHRVTALRIYSDVQEALDALRSQD